MPLMKCGHAAQAVVNDKPICLICYETTPDAEVPTGAAKLDGRIARCDCGFERPSSLKLPFFEHQNSLSFDRFYCGHGGWD